MYAPTIKELTDMGFKKEPDAYRMRIGDRIILTHSGGEGIENFMARWGIYVKHIEFGSIFDVMILVRELSKKPSNDSIFIELIQPYLSPQVFNPYMENSLAWTTGATPGLTLRNRIR